MRRKFKVMCNSKVSDGRYEKLRSKQVQDSDGFLTDYTMYYDHELEQYVFVFGDNDMYDPETSDHDYECEDKDEAYEWFENYSSIDEDVDKGAFASTDINSNVLDGVDADEYISKLASMVQQKLDNTEISAIVEPGDASKAEAIHIEMPDNPAWYVSIPESKLCYIAIEDCDYIVEFVMDKMNSEPDDELSEANLKQLCLENGATDEDATDAAQILYKWCTAEGETEMPPLYDILNMCDAADDPDEANIVLRAVGYVGDEDDKM